MSWTIQGEAGKALNATPRTPASMNLDSMELTFSSLAPDTLQWTAATTDATGAGTIVPEAGQIVEAYYSGVRKFRGHVTLPRIRGNQLLVTVEGPWWWLNKISLTSTQTDGVGGTDERPSFVFATGSLKTSVENLIDRMIADGVPITRGAVATMFTYPRVTLSEVTYAQALASLLSIVPDAVAYFDYSGGGLPALCVARRGSMTAQTLDVGTHLIEQIDLAPRLDLEVKKVSIKAVSRRASDGRWKWEKFSSGTATPGKNQIIVTSGPEVNAILPKDVFESFKLKTFAMPTGGIAMGTLPKTHSESSISGAIKEFILARDQGLATMIREFGASFKSYLFLSNGGAFFTTTKPTGLTGPGFFTTTLDKPNLLCTTSTAGLQVVCGPDRVPEWAATQNGYVVKDATLTAIVRLTLPPATYYPSWWAQAAQRASKTLEFGYKVGETSALLAFQRLAVFSVSLPVQLINATEPTLKTIYRRHDYDYVAPPTGLAADLLAAQNWLPWEGSVTLVGDAVTGSQDLDLKTHVTGALAGCTTMGALMNSLRYDILRSRKTLNFGAPARTDFGTLASRFRRNPKDNITYI